MALAVNNRSIDKNEALQLLSSEVTLDSINIRSCVITKDGAVALFDKVLQLKKLVIYHCSFSVDTARALVLLISQFSQLTSFEILECSIYDSISNSLAPNAFTPWPHIVPINLPITQEVNPFVNVAYINSLNFLAIMNNAIFESGAKVIASSLRHHVKLHTLLLFSCSIGEYGAEAIASSLEVNTTLFTLYVSDNKIGDNGARALAMALVHNSTLEELKLCVNDIGSIGAIALASMLAVTSTLSMLDIHNNPIGDKGVSAIAHALESNRSLKYLGIFETGCSSKGVIAMVTSLSKNSTLLRVDMHQASMYSRYGNHENANATKALSLLLMSTTTLRSMKISCITADTVDILLPVIRTNVYLDRIYSGMQDNNDKKLSDLMKWNRYKLLMICMNMMKLKCKHNGYYLLRLDVAKWRILFYRM